MNRKVGVFGSDGTVKKSYSLNTSDFLGSVGANTGNLFFQYAVYNEVAEDKYIIGRDLPWDAKIINEKCRILVVPSANFLRENFDLSGYVNFLEKCDLPLLFLGLGAQADNFDKKIFDFDPSIRRLIDLIKERSLCVGVRGQYSAEILSSHGVGEISIIGCPSNFINKDDLFVEKLQRKWELESSIITTTGDEPWPKIKSKKDAEQKLFAMAFNSRGLYVQQSVEPLVRAVRSANPYCNSLTDNPTALEKLRLALAPDIDLKEFHQFLVSSVRLYISVDQWMEDMSRFDLSIGLRLHGNMVPFQAGCPSIWVCHDSRTKELVDTMGLPSLSLDDFLISESIKELKDRSGCDFLKYKTTREILYKRYKELFFRNNINVV